MYRAPPIDRSILPTAPRAAREPNIDRSRLPKSPPYTAFLGNLPYDVTEESIKDFFRGLNVSAAAACNGGCEDGDFGPPPSPLAFPLSLARRPRRFPAPAGSSVHGAVFSGRLR